MSAVKALQQWCRLQCDGYRDVSITNMTTSFRDGLAFCALIHKHRPELINFDSLKKENVYDNNKLAFSVAEEQLGIPALLDAEDMVALKVPDRLSILTYVSQYYNYFHGRSPIGGMGGIKRPAETPTDEPSGKKNQPVTAKVFPPSKPARENSPPPSSNISRPAASPKQSRNTAKDVLVDKSHQTGTLSNRCVSCNKHVHLVQRHLVDGKLYHRSCAKLLSPTAAPILNAHVSKFTPLPDSSKTSTPAPSHTPSRLGPSWLTEKPPSTPSQPASSFSPAAKGNPAALVSKPAASVETSTSTTSSTSSKPTAAPRTSTTAAKTLQSKLKFFQSDKSDKNDEEKKTSVINVDVNKSKTQEIKAGQTVTVVLNAGGTRKKDANESLDKVKASGVGAKSSPKQEDKAKASAAAFISKKLAEENNNNSSSKPSWTSAALKKTEKPQVQVETPKKETEAVRGRVRLKVDRSILDDLVSPEPPKAAPSPTSRTGIRAKSPERGEAKPGNNSENESPADWRSMLKPVGKEAKPAGPSQSSAKPLNPNGAGRTSEPSSSSSSSSHLHTPNIHVTPAASKGVQNGQKEQTANGVQSELKASKTKPDYIPKDEIIKELQDIEDNLNELEKRGVELEVKLRRSEEEGDDDELMVEWFNLIRNKQVAIRRESELVYIGRTQDLEEEQPNVEQELRRLMDKPEHLKTSWDRKKEKQLMDKLMEIINDRNAIVDGLDEDRLREEEEDEELNKMMMNFNIKKDKPKKKSPMSKLFGWGGKKEG